MWLFHVGLFMVSSSLQELLFEAIRLLQVLASNAARPLASHRARGLDTLWPAPNLAASHANEKAALPTVA